MRDEAKAARKAQIEAAAYQVLAEKGFQNMSMLAVAKAAKASNETLYRWYGDKTGLFRALIETNADLVARQVSAAIDQDADAWTTLERLGPQLLSMLLSDQAVALNRAAAADATGVLGPVLAEAGRGRVFPLIVGLMSRLVAPDHLSGDALDLARLYVDLLVGDLQIRRATGALDTVAEQEIAARAERALSRLRVLASPD